MHVSHERVLRRAHAWQHSCWGPASPAAWCTPSALWTLPPTSPWSCGKASTCSMTPTSRLPPYMPLQLACMQHLCRSTCMCSNLLSCCFVYLAVIQQACKQNIYRSPLNSNWLSELPHQPAMTARAALCCMLYPSASQHTSTKSVCAGVTQQTCWLACHASSRCCWRMGTACRPCQSLLCWNGWHSMCKPTCKPLWQCACSGHRP